MLLHNRLGPLEKNLERGQIVLLKWDSACKRLTVWGMEQVDVFADNNFANWANDPLLNQLIHKGEKIKVNPRISEVIEAMGGALPVAVEAYYFEYKQLYFNRHSLFNASFPDLSVGSFVQARLLGILESSKQALLAVGGHIFPFPVSRLISGVPVDYQTQAAASLLKSRLTIWLSGSSDGQLDVGLMAEKSREIYVNILFSFGSDSFNGFVVQSQYTQKFYILPSYALGWINDLPKDTLDEISQKLWRKRIKVKLIESSKYGESASIRETSDVRQFLEDLRVEQPATVHVVAELQRNNEYSRRYLVHWKSVNTLSFLDYRDDGGFPPPRMDQKFVKVNVFEQVMGYYPMVSVTLREQFPVTINLPEAFSSINETDFGPRRSFINFLISFEAPLPTTLELFTLETMADDELRHLLCIVYRIDLQGESSNYSSACIDIANEWIRRFQAADSLDLHYALMSIMTVNRYKSAQCQHQGAQQAAMELLRNIGSRIKTSYHIEPLARWLFSVNGFESETALGKRFNRQAKLFKAPYDEQKLKDIGAVARAIEIANDTQMMPYARAIRAATGSSEHLDELAANAPVLRKIQRICNTYPKTKSGLAPLQLEYLQRKAMKEVFQEIIRTPLDITLLAPLPEIREIKSVT
jgi:hypothetical protein